MAYPSEGEINDENQEPLLEKISGGARSVPLRRARGAPDGAGGHADGPGQADLLRQRLFEKQRPAGLESGGDGRQDDSGSAGISQRQPGNRPGLRRDIREKLGRRMVAGGQARPEQRACGRPVRQPRGDLGRQGHSRSVAGVPAKQRQRQGVGLHIREGFGRHVVPGRRIHRRREIQRIRPKRGDLGRQGHSRSPRERPI